MKATSLYLASALTLTFAIAACVPSVERPAPPPTPPVAMPAPAPPPLPVMVEPEYENYLDAPQTIGTWRYVDEPGESLAIFGAGAARSDTLFILRCDKASRRIGLGRASVQDAPLVMDIVTETLTRRLSAQSRSAGLAMSELAPDDPLLDAMAITKGRFAVSTEGERTLYLPAWTEVTRVIEDCR
ncbi:MAG: hypothetical protein WA918_10700 [Erythrobacter sp.]